MLEWREEFGVGDAATPEVLEAWKEAYFFLADILIAREKELYAAA